MDIWQKKQKVTSKSRILNLMCILPHQKNQIVMRAEVRILDTMSLPLRTQNHLVVDGEFSEVIQLD